MDEARLCVGCENLSLEGDVGDDRMACMGDGSTEAGIFGLSDFRSCCLRELRFRSESG